MPIYEYAATDGTKIELIRPMADADKPVADPEGKGRTFTRVMSTVAVGGGGAGASAGAAAGGSGHVHSGMCGCGKRRGSCGGGA
ncbi:MAG: zinc ribbon domain-containing protein [Chloroflexi bacterium]|nr:zinc ribbon domain-containing protein [Chloroflexota bacterium]